MATITGFVKPKRDYAVFAIVTGMKDGIPLVIEKGNFFKKMWKLPGGRPQKGEYPEITLLRELDDEIGVIAEYPEKEIFKKEKINEEKTRYDFIVFKAKYFNGEITAKAEAEIERVEQFNFSQIKQMIERKEILSDHAEALARYFESAVSMF